MNIELDDYTAQQLARLAALRDEPDLPRLANELLFAPLAAEILRTERTAAARRTANAHRIRVDHG